MSDVKCYARTGPRCTREVGHAGECAPTEASVICAWLRTLSWPVNPLVLAEQIERGVPRQGEEVE